MLSAFICFHISFSFFFSSRRRHTRWPRDWSSDVCSSDLDLPPAVLATLPGRSDRTPAQALVTRLGGVLPEDVVVRAACEVPAAFDARFGALGRRYRYRISDGPEVHDPLRRDVLRHRRPLDVETMDQAGRSE